MFDWTSIEPRLRRFTGESLREVAFPLGGIGTGTISLGGRGNLRDWEIFNRPAKGRHLPFTFFSIRTQVPGAPPVARVLERRILPPYDSGFGLPTGLVSGLPRLEEATFIGGYPLARIAYKDGRLPLDVTLEAFNPFIPMNDRDSGIPVAIFVWTLKNAGNDPVDAGICLSALNACGLDGTAAPGNRHHPQLGLNLNRWIEEPSLRGIAMSTGKYSDPDAQAGTMAIATTAADITYLTRWERAGWFDDIQSFWDAFCAEGRLPNGPHPEEPSPDGQTDVASLSAHVSVAPGASVEIPFFIAWRFANLHNHWNAEQAVRGARLGNWYATQWASAWEAARYTAVELPRLVRETQAYCDAFFTSTLPDAVLDAASANVSTIRTTTAIRVEDGRFHGFEGCSDNVGCCPMNCTHVWNYAQALPFLFPALERSVRETDFLHNTRPSGDMAFRTLLPLKGCLWDFKPAADGQMGTILKVYREWLQCGDLEFLKRMWPAVSRALEFAWSPGGWDADQDGVMEGEQHNTYDIEFHGPNTMMGTLYLAALRAAEEMANVLGDADRAARYRSVYEAGRAKLHDLLWNGSFYKQIVLRPGSKLDDGELEVTSPAFPRYQHGHGCLSDQLLGQWFARVVGLGDLLPCESVRQTLKSIHRHNFKSDLTEHASVQRVYALNDEAGLLLCTWPDGGRPAYPFPYADEVWTGIEYQAAAHMIYEGLIEEGLQIVTSVRNRHDGAKRNPWNEFECGHHYARAMSSWSLVLALSGYHYDAAHGVLIFRPVVPLTSFRCFFSAGSAWGRVEIADVDGRPTRHLNVVWGALELRRLSVPPAPSAASSVTLNGVPVSADPTPDAVVFDTPVRLSAGDTLTISG